MEASVFRAIGLVLFLVITTVLTHFRVINALMPWLLRRPPKAHSNLLIIVFGMILAHLLEILIYSAGYYVGENTLHLGGFSGVRSFVPIDYFTLSAETFTTAGIGDVYATGSLRIVAGIEAINGLILIAWSGSCTYFVADRLWRETKPDVS
ncbi:MAG: potassium transporter Kef [Verrucomicrobia bacterium]|nr:potassium transporter Kef [Verrucomicrobiota bacterium]